MIRAKNNEDRSGGLDSNESNLNGLLNFKDTHVKADM